MDFVTIGWEAFGSDVEMAIRDIEDQVSVRSISKISADIDSRLNSIKSQVTLHSDGAINEASY